MIDPMRVCELDDGRPKYQVPRFQSIAAAKRANTIAKPPPLPTWRMSSTGRSETMPKATAHAEAFPIGVADEIPSRELFEDEEADLVAPLEKLRVLRIV